MIASRGGELSNNQVNTILRLCSKDFSPEIRISTIFTFCNMARNGQKLSQEELSILEFAVLGKNIELTKYSIESLELYTKFKIDLPRSTINVLEKSLENKELRNSIFPVIKNIVSNNQELSESTLQALSKFLHMPAKEEVYQNALAVLEIADANIELQPEVESILELEQYGNIIKRTSDNEVIRNFVKKLRDSTGEGKKLSDNNLEIITDLLKHKDDNIKDSCIYALYKAAENSQKLSEKSINEIGKLIRDPSLDIEAVKTLEHVVKNGQILPEDIIKTLEELVLDHSLSKHVISVFKTLSNRGMYINNPIIKAANSLIISKKSENQTKRDATSLLVSAIQNNQDLDITHSWLALNTALKDSDDTIVKYTIYACKLISQKQNKLPDPILEQLSSLAENNNNRELSHYAIEALEAASIIQPKDISSKFELIKSRQILNTSDIKTQYATLKKLEHEVKSGQKLLYSNFVDLELMLKGTDEDLRVLTAQILNNYVKNNNELPKSTIEAITSTLDDSSINVYTSKTLLQVIQQKNLLPDKTLEKLCSLLIDEQELEVHKNARSALEIAKHQSILSKDILDTLFLENASSKLTEWTQSSKLKGLFDNKYKHVYEAIEHLGNAAENKKLLPFNALLSLGSALADKKVCQSSLKVITLAAKNDQHLPKMLLNNLEAVLRNDNKTNKIIATEIFTQVLQNGQKLENSSIEALESLVDQGNNYIIPVIKCITQSNNDLLLKNQTLEKLGDILLNDSNQKIRYNTALIIRSASQKQFLPEKVIDSLAKVLYDNTHPDIQKLAFSSLRYCIQNGQDCVSVIYDAAINSLADLSQEIGSEALVSKFKNIPFDMILPILDTVLSREYLDIKIIKNSPIENWSRNLLCSDLLDQISDKQETEIYKFFENLTKLEEHNSYDKYDENRDNILRLLIEKQNSDGLNLQRVNEILILLKIGHEKALELLSSNSINWEKNLKDQWLKTKINARLLPADIQNLSYSLGSDQLHWSLGFIDKFLETRIDNVKQLIDFLHFVKEYNISEFDLNELSKNLSINNLQDWKFYVENNVLKNKLASTWTGSRSLLSRVNDGIDEILTKGWAFDSIEQIISKFGNKKIVKSKQDSCEYFVESLNIINSYNITSDSRDIEGLKAIDIFERYKPQEWTKKLHNLAISINFESEGNEKNLNSLIQEISKINTNNKAISSLLNNKELLKQFNKALSAYDKPSSLEFSSIVNFDIKNLNFSNFNKPIKDWDQRHINMWSSMVSESVDTQSEKFLPEMIAVTKRAMLLHSKHEPRIVQILSVLIMLNSKEKGRLAQIATGEGKSTTVAMLAAIKALQGKQIGEKVDIITSSPLLAKRDAEEQSGFYSMFGLTVGDNGDEVQYSSGPKDCYKKDIVYGDSSNFQFDVLRDEYSLLGTRDGRKFGSVIIDEVDSMLIDESAKIARLANSMPGMEYLEPLFTTIWHELDRLNKRFVKLEGKLHWVGQDFEIKDGIVKIKPSEDGDDAILPVDDPYEFTKTHIINNYIDPLISKEKNHIPENLKLRIPEHLRNFVSNQLPKWVDNAILAKTVYKEGHHYLITNDENKIERITPVDFASTGIIQNSTTWSDGLHQFLQIKHGLKITPESLTTNFLSNMGYFRRYENKVYGLTGTLGSQDSQDLLSNIYPVDVVKIPSYKQKQFLELPGIVAKNENEWLEKTLNNAIGEAKKDRAVLIICETINQAEQIYQGLNKDYISNRVKLYTRNDNDEQKAVNHQIDAGEIIVATNLAGRGTDIKTTKTVEDNGGLHVSVTFLPSNLRVEEQAFGRTARQGKRGTAVLIIDEQKVKEQLNSICPEYPDKESNNIATIKDWRNKAESARLQKVRETEIEDIGRKDRLFKQFCDLLKELKSIEDDKYRLSAVEERWGLWLKDIDNENQDIYERFESFKSQILKEYKQNKVIKNPYYYIAKADSLIDDANASWTGFKKVMTNIATLGIAKTGREELREQAIENLTEAINLDPIFSFAAYVSRAYLYIEAKSSDYDYKQKARLDLIKAQENISSYIIPQLQNMKLSSNVGNIETNEGKRENLSNQIITKLDILNIYLQHIQQALSVVEESQKLIDVTFSDKTIQNTFAKLTEQEVREKITGENNSKKLIKLSFHDLKLDTGDMADSDQAINTINKVNKDYKGISIKFKNLTHDKAKELIKKSSQELNIGLGNITQNEASELIKAIENTKINNITISFNGLKNYESIEVVNNSNVESVILGSSDNKKATDVNLRIDKENCIRKIQDINEQHNIIFENLSYKEATDILKKNPNLPISLTFNNIGDSQALKVIDLKDSLTISFNNLKALQAKDVIKSTDQRNFVLSFCDLDSRSASDLIKKADRKQQDIKVSLKNLEESFLKTDQPTEELKELYTHGVHKLITIQENNPIPWWSIATVAGLGFAQIIGGACLVVFTAGFGSTVGFGLITEGVSDLFAAASGIYNRDFSWKDYAIQKAVSMTICLATAGLSALKNAAKAAKKVGEVAVDVGTKVATTVKKGAEKVVVAVKGLTTKAFKQVGTHVATTIVETGAKKALNYAVDKVSSAVLEKVKYLIADGVEQSMLENFKEKKCSNITTKALAVDKYYQIDMWKSRIEQSGFKIVHPNKNEYLEASKSIAKGLLKGALGEASSKSTGNLGKALELSSMAINSTKTLVELPLLTSNFHSSYIKELEQINQKLPSINDFLVQKHKDITKEEAIGITDTLKKQYVIQDDGILNVNLIENKKSFTSGISTNYNSRKFNNTIQKYEYTDVKEGLVSINDINLGEHQKHKDKVINVCTEFNQHLTSDYSFTKNMMHKKLIDLVTNQIIQLIQGELISPWANYGVSELVDYTSEKIQRSCTDGNTVKELINQTKSQMEILKIANEMIDNNMEKGTGIIGDDPDKFVDKLVDNVMNNGEAGLLELGALAALTGISIDVLEDIQKLNKENSDNDKIELGFEEETNEKSSHWTNGKDVKSSGKNNCLYDAIAQRAGLNISGQELRQKVVGHIKNNSYFYQKMQPAVEYIQSTSYGNIIKAKNLLMIGGKTKEEWTKYSGDIVALVRELVGLGAANQNESEELNLSSEENKKLMQQKIAACFAMNESITAILNKYKHLLNNNYPAEYMKQVEVIAANTLHYKTGCCQDINALVYIILRENCPQNVEIQLRNAPGYPHTFVAIKPRNAKDESQTIIVDAWPTKQIQNPRGISFRRHFCAKTNQSVIRSEYGMVSNVESHQSLLWKDLETPQNTDKNVKNYSSIRPILDHLKQNAVTPSDPNEIDIDNIKGIYHQDRLSRTPSISSIDSSTGN